jgi:pyruvate dehydrogenase E1 component beta subunit
MTVREALREAMSEEMRRDETVFLMGEEVGEYQGAYKISQGMLDEFGPKRVVDTPITEHGFAGIAVGAAFGGLKPIVEFMTFNFAMQAMDHLINSAPRRSTCPAARWAAPSSSAAQRRRRPRGAQHSQDYAPGTCRSRPAVVMPYSAADAKGLMKTAIRDPNPVIFLENEILYGRSFEVPVMDDFTIPFGKAKIERAGKDVTVVSFGIGMTYALQAAEELAKQGIEAEVINLRSLRPMDLPTSSSRQEDQPLHHHRGRLAPGLRRHYIGSRSCSRPSTISTPRDLAHRQGRAHALRRQPRKLALVTVPEVIEAVKQVTYR